MYFVNPALPELVEGRRPTGGGKAGKKSLWIALPPLTGRPSTSSGRANIDKLIKQKEKQMNASVKILDFETAAILRDEIKELEKRKTE